MHLQNKDMELLNTTDVVQIYRDLGEPEKAIEYQKALVAELEKQNELNNSIESRRKLLEQYRKLVDYLEEARDYKTMCKYTWELYELYRMEKERFSTYNTRFECAKYLQKHVGACILSSQFSGIEKNIIESFMLAEDANNLQRYECKDFLCVNYIYLSQVYAAQRNYTMALTTIAKARQMSPYNEEAKTVEMNIKKKAKK